jgi:hypothetical protein
VAPETATSHAAGCWSYYTVSSLSCVCGSPSASMGVRGGKRQGCPGAEGLEGTALHASIIIIIISGGSSSSSNDSSSQSAQSGSA